MRFEHSVPLPENPRFLSHPVPVEKRRAFSLHKGTMGKIPRRATPGQQATPARWERSSGLLRDALPSPSVKVRVPANGSFVRRPGLFQMPRAVRLRGSRSFGESFQAHSLAGLFSNQTHPFPLGRLPNIFFEAKLIILISADHGCSVIGGGGHSISKHTRTQCS